MAVSCADGRFKIRNVYIPKTKAAWRDANYISKEKKKEKNSIKNVQNVFIFFRRLGYNYAFNNAYTTGKEGGSLR